MNVYSLKNFKWFLFGAALTGGSKIVGGDGNSNKKFIINLSQGQNTAELEVRPSA